MRINTNVYKKLIFFLTIFTFHDIRVEEETPEESVQQEEVEDIDPLKRMSRGINNKDLADFCALLAKQTVHQLNGGNSTNTLTSLEESLAALTVIVNNLPIVNQLGLINTSAANPALTTTFILTNPDVDTYNNNIAAALVAVAIAVSSSSRINTATAQALLDTAIHNFNNIIAHHGNTSVNSMYSLAEINSALAQLNAQLSYLYFLQGA